MPGRKDARTLAAALAIACALVAHAPCAFADQPADNKAAHEAYERGARAFGQGSYSVAATEFSRADELLPSPAALEAALKAAILAEDPVLAMTLVDRAASRPASPTVATQVARARDRFADKVGRLTITCPAPCSAKVGNEPVVIGAPRFYRAGNYVIEITSGSAPELFAVQLPGGATMDWKPPSRTAPPVDPSAAQVTSSTAVAGSSTAPAVAPSSTVTLSAAATSSPAPLSPRASRLSPAWFGVGAVLTTVAAGVTIGFGVDTLSQHDAFLKDPTAARASAGRDAELRTNVLIGVTAATAVTTAILGYFVFRSTPAAASGASAPRAIAWSPKHLGAPTPASR